MPRSKARRAKPEAVIDTSCLTCLLHLGLLQKLGNRYEVVRIPRHVWNEARRKKEKKPSIYNLQALLRQEHPRFKKCYVTNAYRVQLLTDRKQNPKNYIHRGEAEVIIQASELQIRGHNVAEVLIDERMGTNIARQNFRFEVRATGGVLAMLKRERIIKESVGLLLKKCRNEIGFTITDEVINQVLQEYEVE